MYSEGFNFNADFCFDKLAKQGVEIKTPRIDMVEDIAARQATKTDKYSEDREGRQARFAS